MFDCFGAIFKRDFVNFKSILGEETQKILWEPSHAWMESIVCASLNILESWIIDMTRIIPVDK